MRAVIRVEAPGEIYSNHECGFAQVDATAELELPDLDATIALSGFVMLHDGDAMLDVQTKRPIGRALSIPGAALSHDTNGNHRLVVTFKPNDPPSGFIVSWTDYGEGDCMRATLPADGRACPWAAREVAWDTRVGDFALDDALGMLERVGPQPLRATADTTLELTITKGDGPVCADLGRYLIATAPLASGEDIGTRRVGTQLTAPVKVQARASDGSFDVMLPLTLRAVASEAHGLELIAGSRSATGVDSQVDIVGSALALAGWLDAGNPESSAEQSAPTLVKLEMSLTDDHARGRLIASELKRAKGWPAAAPPREPNLQTITEVDCVGFHEGAEMQGGYFGETD